MGLGEFAERGPIKLGTAHFDTGRCLPYSKNIPCVVCEEVCPTSPKAIHTQRELRTVRDGRKAAIASTDKTVTLTEWPKAGKSAGTPVLFNINEWSGNAATGDETTSYYIAVQHLDGVTETHRVIGNDVDTLMIAGRFARTLRTGSAVTIQVELKVPKVDTSLCIGCGICERECPVVGDRRAVYVTAEGETRSQDYGQRDRNRSVRLIKTT